MRWRVKSSFSQISLTSNCIGPDIRVTPFRQRDGVLFGVEGGAGAVGAARLERHPDRRRLAPAVVGRPRRGGWLGLRLKGNSIHTTFQDTISTEKLRCKLRYPSFSYPCLLLAECVVLLDGHLDGDDGGERLEVGAGNVAPEAPVRLAHQAHVPVGVEPVRHSLL